MPYNKYIEHPLEVKHGFVAWALAFALVMFGYNSVVPFFNKVEASAQQATISAAPTPVPVEEDVPEIVTPVEPEEPTTLDQEIIFDAPVAPTVSP